MPRRRQALAMIGALAVGIHAPTRAASAPAPIKLTLSYVPGIGNLSFFVADSKGYFKEEGIAFEGLPINTGPGVASAVASKSADVGFGGMLPTIVARAEGIPFKFMFGGYYEQDPLFSDSVVIASIKSGIQSIADLKGKTIAVNNASGINDLQVRLKLKEAGIPLDSVKILAIPFPQMQAALEIGNADAVGTVDPFSTSIVQKKIGKIIARGYVQQQNLSKPIPVAGYYATEEWIKANPEAMARLKRSITKADEFIASQPTEAKALLMQRLKFPPALAEALKLPPFSTTVDPVAMKAIVDAALEVGILKKPVAVQDVLMEQVQ